MFPVCNFFFNYRKSLIFKEQKLNWLRRQRQHQFYRLAKHQLGMCITPSHLIRLFIFKKCDVRAFFLIFTRALVRFEKKNCLSRFRDIQKSAKSPNFEWSCTYTVGEKTGWFQDRMNENTPISFVASK